MKKECPRCSCYAEPIVNGHNEYCVMCEWEVTIPYTDKDREDEE